MKIALGLATGSHRAGGVRWIASAFVAGALAAHLMVPRSATATIATLTPVQDSWLEQANQDTNYGGDASLLVQGGSGLSQPKKRALVQFDLSSIPACANVSNASLTLHLSSSTASTTHEVSAVTQSWTENGVTWLRRDGSNSWTAGGGDHAAATATATTGTAAGPVTWDVTADVQAFVSGSSPNNGWLVKVASEGTAVASTYDSREGTTTPSLTVTYTLVDAACDDGNECTVDTCTASGCQNQVQVGQLCDDPTDNQCTHPDTCDANGICQPNDEGSGTPCGNAGTECKNQDTCDGAGSCVDNGFKDSGTTCGDATDDACTHPDTCDGAGACLANNEAAGTLCGRAGTECINQDTCDGSGSCTDNGFKPSGTSCGDPSQTACTDPDSCDGAGACRANNQADGTGCDDGEACTATDTCQAGTCVGADVICGAAAVCSPQPKTGCRLPAVSRKAAIFIKNTTSDKADRLSWRWVKGSQTTSDEFGDPVNGATGYRLCVYDETGGIPAEVKALTLVPGGTCGPRQKPCWKKLGRNVNNGYLYTDPAASGDGVFRVLLRAGDDGKARVIVRAKGSALAPPPLPLQQEGAVIVQFNRTDDPSMCWEAEYSGPANRDAFKGIKFSDKAD